MAHGLVFLPVLLSLVGPPEIDIGAESPKTAPAAAEPKNAKSSTTEVEVPQTPAVASVAEAMA